MTMVERVARALVRSRSGGRIIHDDWWARQVASYYEMRAQYGESYTAGRSLVTDGFRDARAAIEAMREPTSEMLNAGDSYMGIFQDRTLTGYDCLADAWPAMIDEALKDEDEPVSADKGGAA